MLITDWAITDWAITDRAITDRAITDRAITDWAITDRAITNWAITDRAITAPPSIEAHHVPFDSTGPAVAPLSACALGQTTGRGLSAGLGAHRGPGPVRRNPRPPPAGGLAQGEGGAGPPLPGLQPGVDPRRMAPGGGCGGGGGGGGHGSDGGGGLRGGGGRCGESGRMAPARWIEAGGGWGGGVEGGAEGRRRAAHVGAAHGVSHLQRAKHAPCRLHDATVASPAGHGWWRVITRRPDCAWWHGRRCESGPAPWTIASPETSWRGGGGLRFALTEHLLGEGIRHCVYNPSVTFSICLYICHWRG